MSFETAIAKHQDFTNRVWDKLIRKMPHALQKASGLPFIPYTTRENEWQRPRCEDICWWTNGFWPAMMWHMYLHTGEEAYRTEAEHAEEMLDEAFEIFDLLHHDVGFMWLISAGVHFRLDGNDASRKRTLRAANMLAGRFNPNGFIRAWNKEERVGWAIIDCMMNLNLLYWASEYTGDPRFRLIAQTHADTTMKHFVRADGSCEHIVCFDPETGAVLDKLGGQGVAPGSAWSRGQAWGLYGFTTSYLHTRKEEYLQTACRIADFFMENAAATGVPLCDFRQPETDLYDCCAGAIAACGLIELTRITGDERYLEGAVSMLKAMDERFADWSDEEPAILQKCTESYHGSAHHISMVYADCFFTEAMGKLRGEKLFFW